MLVDNHADDETIRQAIVAERLSDSIDVALRAARDDTAPANPGALIALVTRFAALVCGDWTPDRRLEFIDQVADDLADLPGSLVLDALARARRHVNIGRLLVPWVWEDVQRRWPTLQRELDLVTKLGALAAHGA